MASQQSKVDVRARRTSQQDLATSGPEEQALAAFGSKMRLGFPQTR